MDPFLSVLWVTRAAERGGKCAVDCWVCCGRCRSEPASRFLIGSAMWVTDACSVVMVSACSRGAGLHVFIIIPVVWTHAGIPVMWPAAKLFKSDEFGSSQRMHSVWAILTSWAKSSLGQQLQHGNKPNLQRQERRSWSPQVFGRLFVLLSWLWRHR